MTLQWLSFHKLCNYVFLLLSFVLSVYKRITVYTYSFFLSLHFISIIIIMITIIIINIMHYLFYNAVLTIIANQLT